MSFTISPDARAELHRIIVAEARADPALSLFDQGEPQPVPEIVKAAIRAPHDQTAQARAEDFLRERYSNEKIPLQLQIMVNNRNECRDEDLVEIDGLLFAIAAYVLELLRPYTLILKDGRFYLESADEVVGCLSGIKGMNVWL
jgi:hypothetical protein